MQAQKTKSASSGIRFWPWGSECKWLFFVVHYLHVPNSDLYQIPSKCTDTDEEATVLLSSQNEGKVKVCEPDVRQWWTMLMNKMSMDNSAHQHFKLVEWSVGSLSRLCGRALWPWAVQKLDTSSPITVDQNSAPESFMRRSSLDRCRSSGSTIHIQ